MVISTSKMYFIGLLFITCLFGCSKSEKKSFSNEKINNYLQQAVELKKSTPHKAIPLLLKCDSIANTQEVDDELRFDILINIVRTYFRVRSLDSTRYYLNIADNYRTTEKDDADLYRENGNLFWAYDKLDSALNYYNKSLVIYKKLNEEKSQAYLEFNMANILSEKGKKAESLEKYLAAINYFEKDGNYLDVVSAYTNAAGIMEDIGNYKVAQEYIKDALKVTKEYNLEERLPKVYSRLASIYYCMEAPDSSLYYYMLPFRDSSKLSNHYKMISYHNIASIYYKFYKNDSIDTAEKYYNKSLKLANELNHEFGKNINNFYLLSLKLYANKATNYDSIIQVIENYEPILRQGEESQVMEDYYNTLSYIYKQKGVLEQAFNLHKKADSIFVSTLNNSIQEKVLFVESQYQTKLREEELKSKEKLLTKNKIILRIVLLTSILVITFVIYQIILEKRRHLLLSELNRLIKKDKEYAENELVMQKKELASALLNLSHIKEVLQYIKQQISSVISDKKEVTSSDFVHIFRNIDEQSGDSYWQEFYTRFEELQSDFMNELISRHDKLSPSEIRICVLLRLNLSSKDIANLTNRSLRTVENIRYNIRRKMDLPENESLTKYILSI